VFRSISLLIDLKKNPKKKFKKKWSNLKTPTLTTRHFFAGNLWLCWQYLPAHRSEGKSQKKIQKKRKRLHGKIPFQKQSRSVFGSVSILMDLHEDPKKQIQKKNAAIWALWGLLGSVSFFGRSEENKPEENQKRWSNSGVRSLHRTAHTKVPKYGVATISRLHKVACLFCRISSLL